MYKLKQWHIHPEKPAGMNQDEWARRPFDPDLLAKAREIASKYQYTVQVDSEEPWFAAFGVELRGAMGGGETAEACHADIMESMALVVATMMENGEQPPAPASDEIRTAQLNVRLTELEKTRIEQAARRAGFRGVSNYVRAAALDKAG